MGLIREPKEVDMSMKSEPWTQNELVEFRKLMQEIKAKNAKRKEKKLAIAKQTKAVFLKKSTNAENPRLL